METSLPTETEHDVSLSGESSIRLDDEKLCNRSLLPVRKQGLWTIRKMVIF